MMRRILRAARLTPAILALVWSAAPGSQARAEDEAAMPAAATSRACEGQAARYEDGKGFGFAVTRIGDVRIENPLRPLTPETNHVLQVVIAGKLATAYGPDFAALRRGGAPGAVEAMLGGPIRWQAALPRLPDPIAIVTEDGAPLAQLSFRACEDQPTVKAAPQARKKAPAKDGGRSADRDGTRATAKTAPPGFSMPQGAIAE